MSKEIKSSIELAMEKVEKLPRLTKQEIRERQEREYGPVGRTVARRFLAGELEKARVGAELCEHPEDRGEIVRTAFLETLFRSIDMEDGQVTARAIEGIKILVDDDAVDDAAASLDGVIRDYERRKQRGRVQAEEAARAGLCGLGISGSAIRMNLEESESWRKMRRGLERAFHPKVDKIKRELADHTARSCFGRRLVEKPGT